MMQLNDLSSLSTLAPIVKKLVDNLIAGSVVEFVVDSNYSFVDTYVRSPFHTKNSYPIPSLSYKF
jgi:hypothetical protein